MRPRSRDGHRNLCLSDRCAFVGPLLAPAFILREARSPSECEKRSCLCSMQVAFSHFMGSHRGACVLVPGMEQRTRSKNLAASSGRDSLGHKLRRSHIAGHKEILYVRDVMAHSGLRVSCGQLSSPSGLGHGEVQAVQSDGVCEVCSRVLRSLLRANLRCRRSWWSIRRSRSGGQTQKGQNYQRLARDQQSS